MREKGSDAFVDARHLLLSAVGAVKRWQDYPDRADPCVRLAEAAAMVAFAEAATDLAAAIRDTREIAHA